MHLLSHIVLLCIYKFLPSKAYPSSIALYGAPVVGEFFSGQAATSCAINPPAADGNNICVSDGNPDTSICCPAGSACAQDEVSS